MSESRVCKSVYYIAHSKVLPANNRTSNARHFTDEKTTVARVLMMTQNDLSVQSVNLPLSRASQYKPKTIT